MNQIKKVHQLNEQELISNTKFSASWHQDYADTSYIFIGGLPPQINEMDLLIVFSQYGVPTHLKLVRDKTSGISKRFAFLKYERFESCVLAIDNLNGYSLGNDCILKVDHIRYKPYNYDPDGFDANREWDEALEKEMLKDFVSDTEVEEETSA
ncbi:hypothetical protein CANARDRAFT_182889, partial [[Candida] arabinofermentans NRRL YB-2248]